MGVYLHSDPSVFPWRVIKMSKRAKQDRAGKRHDRNQRFCSRTPALGYYLIVTDTDETEKNYFEGLRDSIPPEIRNRIVIHVEKAKTTYDLVDRTKEFCGSSAQQRIPWIVFDRDEVKDFNGIIRMAEDFDIHAGWSNPCFEIWMYAYFGEMPNITDSVTCCNRFADRFKKLTGKEYRKNSSDIYRKLNDVGSFKTAFQLAEAALKRAEDDGRVPSDSAPACTVHRLVKEILDKINTNQNGTK